jgi:Holliday junction resolvase RusA-like endonuclease
VTLTITIPGRPPTPNNRFGNKYAAAKVTKGWRETARLVGIDARNRSGWVAPAVARITVTFIIPTHAHRDIDNLVASTKPLTDGLRDAKVLADDHSGVLEWAAPATRYVRGVTATEYVIETIVPAHPVLGL